MSTLLADAIAELGLEPGQTYTATVGDCEVQVRKPARPEDEPSQFADVVMLDPWFTIPDPPPAPHKVALKFEPDLPSPYLPDDSDLAPE